MFKFIKLIFKNGSSLLKCFSFAKCSDFSKNVNVQIGKCSGFEEYIISKKVQILNYTKNRRGKGKTKRKNRKRKLGRPAQTPRQMCGAWSAPTMLVYRSAPRLLSLSSISPPTPTSPTSPRETLPPMSDEAAVVAPEARERAPSLRPY
jgi:hypothetical protein